VVEQALVAPDIGRLELMALTYGNDATVPTIFIPTSAGFAPTGKLRLVEAQLLAREYRISNVPSMNGVKVTAKIGVAGNSKLAPFLPTEPPFQFAVSTMEIWLAVSIARDWEYSQTTVYYHEVFPSGANSGRPMDPRFIGINTEFPLQVTIPVQIGDVIRITVNAYLAVIATEESRYTANAIFARYYSSLQPPGGIGVPMIALDYCR
jgi:hypothetical protein